MAAIDAEIALLYGTSARMSAAIDADAVVRAYLQQVAAEGLLTCSVTVYEDENGLPYPAERSQVRVLGFWSPGEGLTAGGQTHRYTRDALDAPLDRGETVAIADVHADPRVNPALRRIQAESGRPRLALIPLMARAERRFGLVILAGPEPRPWTDAELRPFQITAALLAASLDARIQERLLQERRVHLARFEERQRLARDLHDSVTQLLFAIQLVAQTLPASWRRDADEGERRTQRLQRLAGDALGEMRALLTELNPVADESPAAPPAEPEPIDAALERLAQRFREPGGPEIVVAARPALLSPDRRSATLRIAGEALANAVRHARARRIEVALIDGAPWTLEVRDDGCGFDPDRVRVSEQGGMGLASLRERARAAAGRVEIVSTPGTGTCVRFRLTEEVR